MFKKLWNWITAKKSLSLTVQETFNKAIDLGHYTHKGGAGNIGSRWMCNALDTTYEAGHITFEELNAALDEIALYIKGSVLLSNFLAQRGIPCSFSDRLAIYQNWENKP